MLQSMNATKQPTEPDPTRLLTLKQVCAATQYSSAPIRRRVRDEQIPFVQPAGQRGHLRFPADVVERLLQQPTEIRERETDQPAPVLAGPRPRWKKSLIRK